MAGSERPRGHMYYEPIPAGLGEGIDPVQAVSRGLDRTTSRLTDKMKLDLPRERIVTLAITVNQALAYYARVLASDDLTVHDVDFDLGSSHAFDPTTTPDQLNDADQDNLGLLNDIFRDLPRRWGERSTIPEGHTVLVQKSCLPGVSLVNVIKDVDGGKTTTMRLQGKNKFPPTLRSK